MILGANRKANADQSKWSVTFFSDSLLSLVPTVMFAPIQTLTRGVREMVLSSPRTDNAQSVHLIVS